MLLKLARRSLWSRRTTALLTIVSLSIGVALLVGVDHLREQARSSFQQTLSGTDLIVGPRGGQMNLLLYTLFQMGQPSSTLSADQYQRLSQHPMVDWAVPIALGDTVQGFPVMGTHWAYFDHYRYGGGQSLTLAQGRRFAAMSDHEVVLGATVANRLGYTVGDSLIIAHGSGEVSFTHHEGHPMTVVGILAPTGTPVDRRVHTTLLAMDAVHNDEGAANDDHSGHGHHHSGHAPHEDEPHSDHEHDAHHKHVREGHEGHGEHAHQPQADSEPVPGGVNAVLLGLKARPMVFALQRELNTNLDAPMTAIIPGVVLTQLWQSLGVAEDLLYLISFLVLLATLTGMMTMLLASMGERRRELAILRAVGAGGGTLFCLIELEVALITLVSLVAGVALVVLGLAAAQPWLAAEFGLFIAINPISTQTAYLMTGILVLALLMGLVPALAAYRRSVTEGLNSGV